MQNFDFSSIPAGSTIDGIVVNIERQCNAGSAIDYRMQVINATFVIIGDDKKDVVNTWPSSWGVRTYGSSTDTWNALPTVNEVKDPDWGIVFSVNARSDNTDIHVDYLTATLFYSGGTNFVKLAGVAQGAGSLAGDLVRTRTLAGLLSGTGTLTGELVRTRTLAGLASGAGTLAGALTVTAPSAFVELAGLLSGSGLLAGDLSRQRGLAGVCVGQGSAQGALTVSTPGGSFVTLAGVGQGTGNLKGAVCRGSYNPPWTSPDGEAIHAVMYDLAFANNSLRDQMQADVNTWLAGKSLWGETYHGLSGSNHNLTVRFVNAEDMDAFMTYAETEAVDIPAQSGSIKKHWCGHAAGQPCQEIEETVV